MRGDLEEVMRDHCHLSAEEICNAVFGTAVKWDLRPSDAGDEELIDDKTVFIVERSALGSWRLANLQVGCSWHSTVASLRDSEYACPAWNRFWYLALGARSKLATESPRILALHWIASACRPER